MAETYHDRKMIKWLPFQALPEQGGFLKTVFEALEYEEKPTLCDDQIDHLNYRFSEAFQQREEVIITYFNEGRRHTCQGYIQGYDPVFKVFMVGAQTIAMHDVLEIT